MDNHQFAIIRFPAHQSFPSVNLFVRGGFVIKRMLLLIFAVVVLQCAFSSHSMAQTSDCGLLFKAQWWSDPLPTGWFMYGPGPGAYFYESAAHKAIPGCLPPCPGCCPPGGGGGAGGGAGAGGSCQMARPIDAATGNTYIDSTDVSLPGLGGGISLQRRWNSVWPAREIASAVGIFGQNWRSTYEERIFMGTDHYLKYSRSDGTYWYFGLSAGTWVVASPVIPGATLSQTSTSLLLTFPNGEQRQFSLTTGMLAAIMDRNGNTTQLVYDSSSRLATVTDPASRHLYFNYTGSSLLVSSVTSDFGVTYSYAYDTSNRLSQVTKPDQTKIIYAYNAQSLISQVTDSNGKVLESHTYDSNGRGLTASQANGVNSVTVTYP